MHAQVICHAHAHALVASGKSVVLSMQDRRFIWPCLANIDEKSEKQKETKVKKVKNALSQL
jgi:hypothetical protein